MSSSNEFYTFSFANGTVTGMTETDGRKSKTSFIGNSDFSVKTNAAGAVTEVTRTELSRKGYAETTVYSDADGDGRFTESLELEVATATVRSLEKMRFTFGANGDVVGAQEQTIGRNGAVVWKNERIDANEGYSRATIDGDTYLVKTETERNSVEFTLYRDDNQDGIWTEIAEGEVNGNSAINVVALVGLSGGLSAAETLVG
ncbi:MAG: hypothetical protein PHI55_01225 [Burkholderiaceae bacterium]|nr:hypothetical protein [Burkholderiaceae bacterium]